MVRARPTQRRGGGWCVPALAVETAGGLPCIFGTIALTVRGWLSTQSFAEQQDFGIRVIIAFGGTV
ncbi:hypothetical protein [Microcoleus anatoxicus]|uniref:Uncharacterized protein n=1 Tax=Microcoleus anatoxicus PTRS2 TaxID=2705321 RepID=A0ABU8YX04_9CYAN